MAEARYRPFGQERWTGGTAVTDFGFTGQRNEAGFSLLDYNARYYDPEVGRFVAADALVPDYAKPQGLNHYAYVYNNPLRFIDPSGHATECGATARGDCEGGGTRVPGPTRDEWTEVDRYAAGITYQDYVAGKAYYFDYAGDPQLQLEDLKRINGFGADSLDGAWRRRTYAKLYAEYALQQKLDIGTDFEVARAALAEARTSDDAAYFLWGLITFGAAIGGVEFTGLPSKAAARGALGNLSLPEAQYRSANRAIGRGTRSSTYNIKLSDTNVLTVQIIRPGRRGYQVMEYTIQPTGTKQVIQKAYDASGNLDHFDPKTP